MKVLTFLMFCLPFSLFAATGVVEEGIILQDELRFLEEAAQKTYQSASLEPAAINRANNSDELDLESTYFNNNGSQDEVSVRAGAPRRRR